MTDVERIAAIRSRLLACRWWDKASPPMEVGGGYEGQGIGLYAMGMEVANVQETLPAVAEFLAHAVADIPWLIEKVLEPQA